jgi:hypothetical protein
VDRAFELPAAQCSAPFLINFGVDLRTNFAPSHGLRAREFLDQQQVRYWTLE